jgi:hypothetical protein
MDALKRRLLADETLLPDDRRWFYESTAKVPDSFRAAYLDRYQETTRSVGNRQANTDLIETLEEATGIQINVATSDEALRANAKKRARACSRIWASMGPACLPLFRRYYAKEGIEIPFPTRKLAAGSILERCMCDVWWRKQLRRVTARRVERLAILSGMVHHHAGLFCSNETLNRRREQLRRNAALLESLEATDQHGNVLTLEQIAHHSIANKAIRRAEIMTRLAGSDRYAQKHGYIASFHTITCPSRFHARHHKSGKFNNTFIKTTPRQAQHYLVKLWARARASLKYHDLPVFGVRVAEPHHDGTPHWHVLLWHRREHYQHIKQVLRAYALADTPDEKGARKRRYTAKLLTDPCGSPVAYVAKYIAKGLDGYRVQGYDEDKEERYTDDSSAERVDAWASCWGIRQYQTIGMPPISQWRELRRLTQEMCKSPLVDIAAEAANNAKFETYIEVQGLFSKPPSGWPVALHKEPVEGLTRYLEPRPDRITGLVDDCAVTVTRPIIWKIGFSSRASARPWTRFNNCRLSNVHANFPGLDPPIRADSRPNPGKKQFKITGPPGAKLLFPYFPQLYSLELRPLTR